MKFDSVDTFLQRRKSFAGAAETTFYTKFFVVLNLETFWLDVIVKDLEWVLFCFLILYWILNFVI